MFETLTIAPPDPIVGLTDAYKADSNPDKINLGVGVYKDAMGQTPVLACVKEAEKRILAQETSKGYPPLTGIAEYGPAVQELLFGADHEIIQSKRAATSQTTGGTGALRVAGDYIKKMHPAATLWLSDPTWANHPAVFKAAAVPTKSYPYFDAASNGLAFDKMIDGLKQIPAGDIILLHGCCHNPTGIDPTPQQWQEISQVLSAGKVLPLLDFAYQGFASGIREDAVGLQALVAGGSELLVCSSFSKNFGLYQERVGALTVVAGDSATAKVVMSHIKTCARANYSFPPAHGAKIVATVLGDSALREQWVQEVADMRSRISQMRQLLVKTLADKGVSRDFSFMTQQHGMFSFSGLTKEQVQKLRDQFAVYIVGSGRINVAGVTEKNISSLCDAIASVL